MREITPEQLKDNTFKLIGKDWVLITAKKDDKVNTMTASWGGLGVMWGKNVAFVVIRPQRYTKEFVDAADEFSLTVLDDSYRKTLSYFGSVSGRDEDKIAKSGLTVVEDDNVPYFEDAKCVLKCKKLFQQPLDPNGFIAKELDEKWYANKDYHVLYVAEIEKVLVK